jgi:hypothetical protein
LLPWHLFVQAIMAGAAGLLMTSFLFNPGPTVVRILGWVFGTSLVVNLFVTLAGEFGLPHASHVAATAAHLITHGKYKNIYRFSLLGGLIVPLILTAVALAALGLTSLTAFASLALLAAASILSIAGLFAYEWAFVMAPQDVPNN